MPAFSFIAPLGCNFLRSSNVGGLRPLVAAAKQERDPIAALREIDPVTRSGIDPHLQHSVTHGPRVARIPLAQARNPHENSSLRFTVPHFPKPCIKNGGLEDPDHVSTIADNPPNVNYS